MDTSRANAPLTIADLAARWQVTEKAVSRRIERLGLPGFNVGTAKEPDWRFRLATVEAWEAQNERPLEDTPAQPGKPVVAGAPAGWDGKDRIGLGRPRPARRSGPRPA